jgi:hypothetical protein
VKFIISAVVVIGLLAVGSEMAAAQDKGGFEPSPVLKASDLAVPELLKGPRFTVDSRVPVKGFLAHFTIRSEYGLFEAHGLHMLQVRVREIHALGQLEGMSKTKEFLEAAGRAVARPVTSTVNMLVHPVDTVKGLPGGVERLFDRIKLGGEQVVAAASAPEKSGEERVADVTERVGSITVTALGYEKERRDLAKGLGVDPYTTNAVLSKKLDDMAWVAFSGRFGIQTAMAVVVPYSVAMSAATITNTTVYDTPAGDLVNSARAVFAGTGATEGQVQALMKNRLYSLSVLTALADGLRRLQGLQGLPAVVQFAAVAKTEDEARLAAAAVNVLARYHETVAALAHVSAPGPILGHTAAGTLVAAAPVDYVAWTERAARFAERDDLKAPERILWLSGRTSPRAQKELEARRWKLFETFSVASER